MSKNISLDEIKKFWPEKAPDINIVEKYIYRLPVYRGMDVIEDDACFSSGHCAVERIYMMCGVNFAELNFHIDHRES